MNMVAPPSPTGERDGSYRLALVSGASRGLGLEVAQQLAQRGMTVLLGVRDLVRGQRLAKSLRDIGMDAWAVRLDVTSAVDADQIATTIKKYYGRLDVLINNAGGFYDAHCRPSTVGMDLLESALQTNLVGAWRLTNALLPMMRAQGEGRIVNVSSGCGCMATLCDAGPAYQVSKLALNAYTRMLDIELRGSGVVVNAVCPGWVATDLGGRGGRSVGEGAAGIVWAACQTDSSLHGGFFRDGHPLAW